MKVASISVFATLAADAVPGRRPPPAAPQPVEAVAPARSTAGFADTLTAALTDADAVSTDDGSRGDAVAQFAQALWSAMHASAPAGGSRDEGEHHDHGRRAHGWNRNAHGYAGLVPQMERLIARYAAAAAAAGSGGSAPDDGTVAPAPGADGAPAPAPTADPAPAPSPAAGTDASAAPATSGADEPPPDRLPVPDPLMASFRAMLTAFGTPLDDADAAGALADFLSRLVDGLRGAPEAARACGGFVSLRA